MEEMPWILIMVAVIIALLAVAAVLSTRKSRRPTDYYALFVMGMIWAMFGMFLRENFFFWIMGIVFMAVGLRNKGKWKKNRLRWDNLTKQERRIRIIIIAVLGLLLLLGALALFLVRKGII